MIHSDGEHETVQYEETIQIIKYIALKRTFYLLKMHNLQIYTRTNVGDQSKVLWEKEIQVQVQLPVKVARRRRV